MSKKSNLQTSANYRTSGNLESGGGLSAADIDAAESLGIALTGLPVDCIHRAAMAQNQAARLFLEAGYLLLKAKSDLTHGDFGKHCEAQGINQKRANELMRIARLYTSATPEQRRELAGLGKSKMLLLADADPEVIEDMLDDPDGGMASLSVRGLRDHIRKLEGEKNNLAVTIENQSDKIRALENKSRLTTYHPRTEEVRSECLALQAEAELPINSLYTLFEETVNADRNSPEWRLQMEQLWVTAHTVYARAQDMLSRVRDLADGEDMPERIAAPHLLTPEEAERWQMDYVTVTTRHEVSKATRQTARENAAPRGRGRPRKTVSA